MIMTDRTKSFASERIAAGYIRPLEAGDVAQVAELHARVVGKTPHASSSPSLPARLSRILLQHPWRAESLPSWVFRDNGKIVGCIGVMPRPMWFNGCRITAAVSHNFMVEPGSRSTLAALELAKRFISGPQDLSMAEGSTVSRTIWEAIGGSTSLLHSLCWTRPLRPGRYVLSFLRRRGLPSALAWLLRPFCRLVDAAAPLISGKAFNLRAPAVSGGELDAKTLTGCLSAFTQQRSLRPQYDERVLNWLLETLAQKTGRGTFEKVLVRNSGQEVVGWYLYYRNPDGIGEVVQMGAKDHCADVVLDHLFYHARRRGLVAVSGQVDHAFFSALSKKDCLFHHDGGSWVLVHSRHPELLHAIHRGDAFLSRLEGEWWISVFSG